MKRVFEKISFYQLLLLRTVLFSFVIITILVLILSIKISFDEQISYLEAMGFYFKSELIKRDFKFAIGIVFFVIFIAQIIQLIGIRNLGRLISGQYHKPREVKRIFMFIDLNNSTSLAEELGNEQYSSFIKEYFNDLSDAINLYGGEIYQYVGDEISIIWPITRKKNHCISCFFKIQKIILDKKNQYLSKFGYVPEFKAGAHVGKVVITEVGKLKKALVYHGDVVNTTSRIIGKCKELNQVLLISEDLLNIVGHSNIDIVEKGKLLLKGKSQRIRIFGISQKLTIDTT